jgi:hypothetical protein
MEEFLEVTEEAELTVRARRDQSSRDRPGKGSRADHKAEADRAVRLEERGILEALSGL